MEAFANCSYTTSTSFFPGRQSRRSGIVLHMIVEENQSSGRCQESQGALPRWLWEAGRDVSSGEDELIGGDPVQWKE